MHFRVTPLVALVPALLASPALAQETPPPAVAPLPPAPSPTATPAPAPEAPPPPALSTSQPPAVPEPPPTLPSALLPSSQTTAGYHNGVFFIRSPDDVFRLYVNGRVHVDYYASAGPDLGSLAPGYTSGGPSLSSLPPGTSVPQGFSLRRARLEMAGEFFERWQWQLGAEFAPSTDTNVSGTSATLVCKVSATTSAQSCAPQSAAVDSPTQPKPAPTDAFVNYAPSPWANLQVGQYYLPFTMENRISDNTTAFMERALVVRAIGAPLQRDIGAMVWGESPNRVLYYAGGIFNGDGPNSPNVDQNYDFAGTVFVRPLINSTSSFTRWTQFGASVHEGMRDPNHVGYDMPSITTSQGFAAWKPTYTDSYGRLMHIMPSGQQIAAAAHAYVPVGKFDFAAEAVYASYDTREAVDGYQLSPYTERLGGLSGWGMYAQVGYWIVGDQEVIGPPSYGRPLHVDLTRPQAPAQHGLEVLARVDALEMKYDGASRGGALDAKTPNGDVNTEALTLGVNYWATRHMRVTLNYAYYALPDKAPISNINELSARFGVQF